MSVSSGEFEAPSGQVNVGVAKRALVKFTVPFGLTCGLPSLQSPAFSLTPSPSSSLARGSSLPPPSAAPVIIAPAAVTNATIPALSNPGGIGAWPSLVPNSVIRGTPCFPGAAAALSRAHVFDTAGSYSAVCAVCSWLSSA